MAVSLYFCSAITIKMGKFLVFLKSWTLPVAITVGIVVYLLFAYIPVLGYMSVSIEPIIKLSMPVLMFLVLYITFCKVDYRKLRLARWHIYIILIQMAFMALPLGAIYLFHIQGVLFVLTEAVFICAICPCATAAAVVTNKLGGNLEEMTTFTFISNFLSALFIPTTFPLVEPAAHIAFWASFFSICYKVSLVLVIPMFLGYVTKHTSFLKGLYLWILAQKNLGFYLWCAVLMVVSGVTMRNIVHANTTWLVLLLIALFSLLICMLQFGIGRAVGRYFYRTVEAGQATGQKNTTFAIWIASIYLNPLSSVGPGFYVLWQNIINSLQLWQYGKSNKPKCSQR